MRKYRRGKNDSDSSSSSEEDTSLWETEESEEDSSSSTDVKSNEDKLEFMQLLSSLFPSKYMSQKCKQLEDTRSIESDSEEEEAEVIRKKHARGKKVAKPSDPIVSKEESVQTVLDHLVNYIADRVEKKMSRKRLYEDESEDIDSDDDEEEEKEEEYENESEESEHHSSRKSKRSSRGQKFNIIFGIKPRKGDDDADDDEDDYTDEDEGYPAEVDEDEECNSEDEATFMKEKYEKIEAPPTPKKSKKGKSPEPVEPVSVAVAEEPEFEDIEKEYLELIELKKQFTAQLKTKPNNRILRNSIDACKEDIQELVKHARHANTKLYHSMVHNERKKTNEMDYFKKKLSNKEQLTIMKDLKEINRHMYIDKPYRLALLQSKMPPKFKAIAMQKLNILTSMDPGDNEYYKIKNWVDAFMRIPFGIYKHLTISIHDGVDECNRFLENAKHTLDGCVYGLNDAKLQIMQMLGQWMVNPSALGTAIAIHGPPGTGKTSIVKDGISKILGREFAFIALGGGGDSSFLEGHSYTYEGSTWGKIVQILMDCKSMNPVIYFDELDKVSDTARGQEIIGILTHLTDTSQNTQFHDKYFSDIDFDISKCVFIFSYNEEQLVNPILRDRMYRIKTKGYDTKDKIIIAKKHLLPKIREQVNFNETDVIIPDDTLNYIITSPHLTKGESGVRNLKRCLEIIYTKLNLFRLIKPDNVMFQKDMEMTVSFPMTITRKEVDVFIKKDDPVNQTLLSMYI